jgi:hypothetical protein
LGVPVKAALTESEAAFCEALATSVFFIEKDKNIPFNENNKSVLSERIAQGLDEKSQVQKVTGKG